MAVDGGLGRRGRGGGGARTVTSHENGATARRRQREGACSMCVCVCLVCGSREVGVGVLEGMHGAARSVAVARVVSEARVDTNRAGD